MRPTPWPDHLSPQDTPTASAVTPGARGRSAAGGVGARRLTCHPVAPMAAASDRPPLIGVTTSEVRRADVTNPMPEGEPPQHEMALGMPYVRALARSGAIPIVLPPLDARARSRRCSRRWPASACRAARTSTRPPTAPSRTPSSGRSSPTLDAFELAVARHADAAGLPILGICRGCQALNVARGGTLLQHLPASPTARSTTARPRRAGPSRTTSQVEAGSRLARVARRRARCR